MRVLMISTDRTLLGHQGIGDAVLRHKEYAANVDRLDILVLSKKPDKPNRISKNCQAIPVYLWNMKKVAKQLGKNHNYNLVVCQDPFITAKLGVYVKRKFGSKLIIHFHGDFLDNPYWLKEHWRNRFYKRMTKNHIKFADSIRVVSEGIKQKLIKREIAQQDIYKIPTPVNLLQFETERVQQPGDKKIILTVGRIVEAKDFPTLIKAAEQVAAQNLNFEWQIVGEGPLFNKFKKKT